MRNNKLLGIGIIVLLLGVVAAIAIPGWKRSSINVNESKALGVILAFVEAERAFKAARYVDQDEDGIGEFGLLGELAGTNPVRGSKGREQAAIDIFPGVSLKSPQKYNTEESDDDFNT